MSEQNCRPRDKKARLGLLQPKAQEERGNQSKECNEQTVESSDTGAKSCPQQMEERKEKKKRELPFAALAGPGNVFPTPLRIRAGEMFHAAVSKVAVRN